MSSQTNITAERGLLEFVFFSVPITVPCCVFLCINGIMLFTLRCKSVFRETSRYVLLFNLLFADTLHMALSQLLFLLSVFQIRLTYLVCGVVVMLADITGEISPLTLVLMSLERYVAVCYPLRHSTFMTIRNTAVAVIVVWAFSSLNNVARVILLLDIPAEDLVNLRMKDFCAKEKHAAWQLGLSLSSTLHNPLIIAIAKVTDRLAMLRVRSFLYVCIILLPRCLSALIYGIRDQTIRPILLYHLCCRLKLPVVPAKAKVSQ
ncbi:hypothetical protein KUCAC02_029533 [Chaenocephalus aceratus]|nr:hypothetical protein KUCAC02_029533 [Chaenocephalus aceratus]